MSVERILKRFYILELSSSQLFQSQDYNKIDFIKIGRFKEIKNNIEKINNDLKKENYSTFQSSSEKDNKLEKEI